ncbi:hypothetical protein MAPG_00821 [Magnaporthiopsis poae ATCC 64411]|uniref:FAD/NAD(P)-binding domain-containing protein n=1 Tax=Magnaporthiopsis poae (strain ATCC 64411 / 73-15) TaxID=644358 RepID=A0A0C4DM21_MAGP6|nr:hypothetical protein MAPG_00821 [Magnaporthiopsis poae ATCC 64411]
MAPKLLSKAGLIWSFFVYTLGQAFGFFRRTRALKKRLKRQEAAIKQKEKQAAAAAATTSQPPRNIVVVGASFAGYYAAQQLAAGLPSDSPIPRRRGRGLRDLGVEVVLNERAAVDADGRVVTLRSGRKIECDLFISCVGQRPSSNILADLSPTSISASGHVRVLPTLQVADASLPNVFACGDVADTGTTNPNARAAVKQSIVVADNILAMILGGGSGDEQQQQQQQELPAKYEPHWADGLIKLTIGLEKSVIHFGDENTEFFWHAKDKDIALKADGAWKHFSAVPFEDTTDQLAQYRQAS